MKKLLKKTYLLSTLLLGTTLLAQAPNTKQSAVTQKDYAKMFHLTDTDKQMQTAIRTLKSKKNPQAPVIKLVGVMHIGEESYYETIQKCLSQADLVLFEGVGKPECLELPTHSLAEKNIKTQETQKTVFNFVVEYLNDFQKNPESWDVIIDSLIKQRHYSSVYWLRELIKDAWGNTMTLKCIPAQDPKINTFQVVSTGPTDDPTDDIIFSHTFTPDNQPVLEKEKQAVAEILGHAMGLVFQIDYIRYDHKNFCHCDISLKQLRELIVAPSEGEGADEKAKNEQAFQKIATMVTGDNQFLSTILGFGANWLRKNPHYQTFARYAMAKSLDSNSVMNKAMQLPQVKKIMDAILIQRNNYVLEKLSVYLKDPQWQGKTIAIFYGAAHLSGMENHLVEKKGYKCVHTEWVTGMEIKGLDPQLQQQFDQIFLSIYGK